METEEARRTDDSILEPLAAYKTKYESEFRRNCEEYFDELVKKSGVDLAQNRKTAEEYEAQERLAEESARRLAHSKIYRGLLIAAIAIGAVLLAIGIALLAVGVVAAGAALVSVGSVAVVLCAVLLVKVIVPRIKRSAEEHAEHQKKADEALQCAWAQMDPLNALFEGNVTKKLIEKTLPLIELDDYFNVRRYDYMSGKYGYGADDDPETSTIGILTGEILGNPFVVDRVLKHTMGMFTYMGSIVIHWETHEIDSEGHSVVVHHSQTLTATVTRPKPYYSRETRLIYGNEAAPDLHFSRKPAHVEDLSEKARASKVKRGVKKIRKKQKKAMGKGSSFTEMGNEEFDVLFGAIDRDDDVQFRLLFTPLAQKNMLALLKDSEGYGDDFYMRKSGCLNYVVSEHSAQWDMEETRDRYQSYSAERSRNRFLSFNEQYFRSLYFDLAPLLSIPLYQQHKPHEYIYRENYPRRFTAQESEYAVNSMEKGAFAPADAATPSILKTSFLATDGASDRVSVTANAYRTEPRVEFVPVFGGDGLMHNVPVNWLEYIPVRAETVVEMKEIGLSDRDFFREANGGKYSSAMNKHANRAFGYHHGILCCVVPDENAGFDADFTIKKEE